MKLRFILMFFALNISMASSQKYDLFEAKTKEANGGTLQYRLFSPKKSIEGKLPVVVFLHGAGERGDNNRAQLAHVLSDFTSISNRNEYPCYIIAPQCPEDNWWTAGKYNRSWDIEWEEEPSQLQKMVMSVLADVLKNPNADPNRVYIGGLSMGGMGTWDMLAHYPDKFAAAFPICGWGNPAYADKIKHVPIWAFHGMDDGVVPPSGSINVVDALKKVGGKPIITLYEGVNHDSWTIPFHDQTHVFDWLFAQRKM